MGGDLSGRLPVTGAGDEFDRLSENLNTMLARIAGLNEGLRQVSDNIAHDLKTPLTRLRNRAEAALAGKPSGSRIREALEATIAESDQLIRTFNAILMISRLEAGYSAGADCRRSISPRSSRDVVELYEPVAEEQRRRARGVDEAATRRGRRQPRTDRPGAVQHRRQCHQIFAPGATGKPTVRVALEQADGEIRLSRRRQWSRHSRRRRPRARHRALRAAGESRSQPGSGLGLSLAKAVMEFHGGTARPDAGQPRPGRRHGLSAKPRADRWLGRHATDPRHGGWLQPAPDACRRSTARSADELAEIAAAAARSGAAAARRPARQSGDVRDFLAAVFDLSPFLRDCVRRRPEMLDALFDRRSTERLDSHPAPISTARRAPRTCPKPSLMTALRRLKLEAHVLIALADLAGAGRYARPPCGG